MGTFSVLQNAFLYFLEKIIIGHLKKMFSPIEQDDGILTDNKFLHL